MSFDYDDEMNLDQIPAGLRNGPRMGVGQLQNPQGNYGDFRTSGNVQQRFQDDRDEVNPDSVTTTFGTLPRGDPRHRRRGEPNDYSLENRPGRTASDIGNIASYATVQKPPRPDQSNTYRTPVIQHQLENNYGSRQEYIRPPLNELDNGSVNDFNVSRTSSYSNVPSTHKSQQQQLQQQSNWESIQKVADSNYMSVPQRSQLNSNAFGNSENYGILPPAKTSSYASIQGGTPVMSNRSRTSYSPAIPENVAVTQMNKLGSRVPTNQVSGNTGGRSPSFERRNDDLIYAPGRSLPINGIGGKMSSFSDAGSDYGGAGGTLTRGTNSSREVTPVSHNGNGQYSSGANSNGMKIYGPSVAQYGHFQPQPHSQPLQVANPQGRKLSNGSGLGVLSPVTLTSPSNLSVGHNGAQKSFGHHERNDSANFSLTSSNESERDPVVTSIV